MVVTLKGIIQVWDQGHKYVNLEVMEEPKHLYKNHRMGVDIKVNRGKVLTFLSAMYGITPGQIVWPPHITVKDMV